MPSAIFHPATAAWFRASFAAPTPAQQDAWPAIASGRNALIAAPTGSGKTLAAFLAAIDALVREGQSSELPDETRIVYVSPLKALSNDVRINLEQPLAGIREQLRDLGYRDVDIQTAVRTGDTPQAERERMKKRAPHVVVTTPESLYILLGSESGRRMLATTRSVIVDEIHALLPSKRGSHLALSIERLEALCGRRLTRIGLSATQKPLLDVARYLVGTKAIDHVGMPDCAIVDSGHTRPRDLAIEVPDAPLQGVMSTEVWQQVYERIANLAREHKTTLVFVNTRRMAERAARHLSERLGKEWVAAHHGSMAREQRLSAEQRLKHGQLRVLVATASLELGIDIGDVDLVCQLGSPRAISAFLQRVGRSGHAVGALPKGRLFPQSRDDLVECAALLDAVRRGELDTLRILCLPLDVLAQQIVAEVACGDRDESALYSMMGAAWAFRNLTREQFRDVVRMLAEGYTTRHGPRSAWLHRDAVNGVLKARRGARLTAITSGGAIPDTADYEVLLEPQAQVIGTVNEDFAIESMAGDIFQLGNMSYRILRVERSRVRVEDAHGAPPSIPFWLGEAPGRSDELSSAVSRLRTTISQRLEAGTASAMQWLCEEVGLSEPAASQLVDYVASIRLALGTVPSQQELVLERFFDESGGTQLILHTPWGSRINRAWGLALRKRFCRKFNFELQAAANEDAIVLSLSTSHSFPLVDVAHYLHSNSVADVLTQALLDAPMFALRWRWNASTALALPRMQGGSRVPPQLQRMKSEDLLATVFPDQVACAENLVGEREIPDHPLVVQTLYDCLHEAMDLDGLRDVLLAMESGNIRIVACDLPAPSPLAAEILSSRPYTFLDDAPLEERRTQAASARGWQDSGSAGVIGKLDADAIAAVRAEAWPDARDADEMHDALSVLGYIDRSEVPLAGDWRALLERLATDRRATYVDLSASVPPQVPDTDNRGLWVCAERLPQILAVHPGAQLTPAISAPEEYAERTWKSEEALLDLIRARLTGLGPCTTIALSDSIAVEPADVEAALLTLEAEGYVMRGRFDADAPSNQWCERHLLARIHRYTVKRLRREIEPVHMRDYLRFLFDWQRLIPGEHAASPDALMSIIGQLEGFEAAAGSWESELLPARVEAYEISWLDELCLAGRLVWTRLRPASGGREGGGPVRTTPIVLLQRRNLAIWNGLRTPVDSEATSLSSRAQAVADYLRMHGASFFDEISGGAHLLRVELEDALAELVAAGRAGSDSFAGLRALLVPASKRGTNHHRQRRRASWNGVDSAGRWSLTGTPVNASGASPPEPEAIEHVARTLLRRYGVVFWRLLEREAAWLPPWRELLRVLQRLEARGEIRGGRFVEGFSGEQFALPDALAGLRRWRNQPRNGELIAVSGSDPLNLVGTLLPGARIPAVVGNRVLYRDGVAVAASIGGTFQLLETGDDCEIAQWQARLRQHGPTHTRLSDPIANAVD
ncbi:MAG: DEAD/DEAH box helicase [Tahibacter sp.]